MLTERDAGTSGGISADPASRKGLLATKIQAVSTVTLLALIGATYCLFRGDRRPRPESEDDVTETQTPSLPFKTRAMMAAAQFLPEPVMRRLGTLVAKMSSPRQGPDESNKI